MPRMCEQVTFCGKKDFVDVTKVKAFEMERLGWIIWVGLI